MITDFDVSVDTIKFYYRTSDQHDNTDISLINGVLSWDTRFDSNVVVIDMSATVNLTVNSLADINDLNADALFTFVEIV